MARTQIDDELVRRLAALLAETNLTEIEYEVGGLRLRVARAAAPVAAQIAASSFAPLPAVPQVTATAAESGAIEAAGTVKSPMVGVAYRGAEPGAKPYVNEGDQVAEGATLLLIEAMKTFNPIMAPRAGRVVRILVGDGQPVEFGEPLLVLA
jgi:acetyl-CoA carboxylase biotin carboxyl carrier protein